jgi:hypothetical protein
MSDEEPQGDLIVQANGRNRYLRDRGEVKTPELIDALIAELEEATGIVAVLLAIRGDGPADRLRLAKVGIGSKTPTGEAVLRARAFLDKAGK